MPHDDFLSGRLPGRRRTHSTLLAFALAAVLVTGCGDSDDGRADPTPSPPSTSDTPTPLPGPSDGVDLPAGEVWQWALGQNVWEDPLYTLSQEQSFSPGSTDVYANTLGFSLTPDEQGVVRVVTLFNAGTGMVAYPGRLPGGLDWSMTGSDLVAELGEETLTAIDGVPFSFSTVTTDGYQLDVYVAALHQDELAGAAMTEIAVRPAG